MSLKNLRDDLAAIRAKVPSRRRIDLVPVLAGETEDGSLTREGVEYDPADADHLVVFLISPADTPQEQRADRHEH